MHKSIKLLKHNKLNKTTGGFVKTQRKKLPKV